MTHYIITIRKDRPVDEASGQTQIYVDLSTGQPRILQVLVTASPQEGLEPSDLVPRIDLDLIVRAFRDFSRTLNAGTEPVDHGDSGGPPQQDGPVTGGARSYRKMPEPEKVLAVYGQTGTITALAEHFGVPRHTAQGWAGRLRRQGFHIGRK